MDDRANLKKSAADLVLPLFWSGLHSTVLCMVLMFQCSQLIELVPETISEFVLNSKKLLSLHAIDVPFGSKEVAIKLSCLFCFWSSLFTLSFPSSVLMDEEFSIMLWNASLQSWHDSCITLMRMHRLTW